MNSVDLLTLLCEVDLVNKTAEECFDSIDSVVATFKANISKRVSTVKKKAKPRVGRKPTRFMELLNTPVQDLRVAEILNTPVQDFFKK